MSATKYRPTSPHARTPTTLTMPRALKPGQRTHWVVGRAGEDKREVTARVQQYEWSRRIVGDAVRVGPRWQFVVRVAP